MDFNASILALIALIIPAAGGWLAFNGLRAGADYAGSRGNPRNRAQAHESLIDLGKGALIMAFFGLLGGGAILWAVFRAAP